MTGIYIDVPIILSLCLLLITVRKAGKFILREELPAIATLYTIVVVVPLLLAANLVNSLSATSRIVLSVEALAIAVGLLIPTIIVVGEISVRMIARLALRIGLLSAPLILVVCEAFIGKYFKAEANVMLPLYWVTGFIGVIVLVVMFKERL